jgi:hypothetical protein
MVTKAYTLELEGYWREPNVSGLPAKSGVYCVYCLRAPPSREDRVGEVASLYR